MIGGFIAHLTLGTLYCWGNFISYAPDKLRFFDGQSHPGQQPDALYVIPFTIIALAIGVPIGPILVKKIGARAGCIIGSWIAATGVYLASYQNTLSMFMLFYAIMFGTGVGLAYTSPMVAGWKWLPEAKGLVSGAVLAGFGTGGFIFSKIGSKTVNPTNADLVDGKFPPAVYEAFPGMLRKLSMMYFVVSAIGSLCITEPKTSEASDSKKPTATAWGLSPSQALKTKQFWMMWAMVLTAATAGLNTASVYKQYAATSEALSGDQFQATVGGIGALFNGFGRLFWGSISDMIGFRNSFYILTVLQAVSMLLYRFSTGSKTTFLVNTSALFFCLAGNFALFPSAVQRMFGPASGATIYGLLYNGFGLASVGGGMLTKSLVKSVGWNGVFQILAGLSLVSTVIATILTPVASLLESSL